MLINKTNNKVIVKESRLCSSPWCQGIGLMFSKEKKDFGLIFDFAIPRKISLHMFFVFYPIDVLFLDENKNVVDIKENFKPWTFYTSKKRVKYVLELPNNTINNKNISLNNKISF